MFGVIAATVTKTTHEVSEGGGSGTILSENVTTRVFVVVYPMRLTVISGGKWWYHQ